MPVRTIACALILLAAGAPARADDLPKKYQEMADRGLEWLAKQQFRDGHWEAAGGQFASAMTGVAGTTLLMEGSTLRDGKYAGWLSSEYEGRREPYRGREQVRRQHAVLRSLAAAP